jgi:hypothetical protein
LIAKNQNQRAAKGTVSQNKSARGKKPLSSQKKSKRSARAKKQLNFNLGAKNTPFGTYSGSGSLSFKTQAPVAFGQSDSISAPQMVYGKDGRVRITHREYLFDVLSTNVAFQVLATIVGNPSLVASFPWLATVALNFEKFCFNRLCYHYVTQSSTSAPGSVMMVPCYNPDLNPPATKQDALAFQDCVRSPAWQESCCNLPEDRLCTYRDYYVSIATNEAKLSIPVQTFVCTSGNSGAGPTQGEIWVEYDIELSCPIQNPTGLDHFFNNLNAASEFASLLPLPRFSDFAPNAYLTAGAIYNSVGGVNTATLQPGRYLLTYYYNDSSGTANITDPGPTFGSAMSAGIYTVQHTNNYAVFFCNIIVTADTAVNRTMTINVNDALGTGPFRWEWALTKVS